MFIISSRYTLQVSHSRIIQHRSHSKSSVPPVFPSYWKTMSSVDHESSETWNLKCVRSFDSTRSSVPLYLRSHAADPSKIRDIPEMRRNNLNLFSSLKRVHERVRNAPMTSLGDSSFLQKRFRGTITSVDRNVVAGSSPRQMADLEERVWSAVTTKVTDPELGVDLQALDWMNRRLAVSQESSSGHQKIQVLLQLPSMLHPSLDELKRKVHEVATTEVDRWIGHHEIPGNVKPCVNVEVLPKRPMPWRVQGGQQDQGDVIKSLGPGLANVSHFLAVYSCKGGVGKSTIAANLAYELAHLGVRVGLLDVDIYGPSLPFLVDPDNPTVRKSPLGSNMVYPIEHRGVKMLSLGFVSSNSGVPGSGKDGAPAVLRGPMAGRVTTQLLKGTDWGDLDILILDLPPGTGDVQLTVCQEVDLSCAIGVTTPSRLAIADSKKGIAMFLSMGINTIAMVENLSYFECPSGVKRYPFGKGFANETTRVDAEKLPTYQLIDPDRVCRLPVSEVANEANENGIPICLSRPTNAEQELAAFEKLAKIVSRELFCLPYQSRSSEGTVTFDDESFNLSSIQLFRDKSNIIARFFSESGALQKRISPEDLWGRDPKTGQPLEKTSKKMDNTSGPRSSKEIATSHRTIANQSSTHTASISAEQLEKKARVGFEVTWSDGSRFIYSRRAIAVAAGGKLS